PSGAVYERPHETDRIALRRDVTPHRWFDQRWPVRVTRLRHVLQVMYVDRLLGDLIDRLKAVDMYDHALIVITSDHGHSVAPGRPRGVIVEENLHEFLWVPLLIKAPGQKDGVVVDANVTAPDLLPTLAEHLGTRVPWVMDGSSALDPNAARGPTKTVTRYDDIPRLRLPTGPISIRIDEAWRRFRAEWFRATDRLGGPYGLGPAGGSIGESIDSFPRADRPAAFARLDGELRFDRVDSERGSIPGLLSGTLDAGTVRGAIVASLNGRIAGYSPLFRLGGGGPLRFMFLLPERLFRSGGNDLDLFLMRDGVLHPLAIR
ncbi:MAG TPA: sulfatase-like hydrolase/transferase, partial [Actinomycetota bacterium]|nr:sulfatase-like hydrolase/transferase [Actinomycetota bacterium]